MRWDCLPGSRDLGINVLDTASAYLLSEERIGKAVADRRGEFFLASKCGEYSNYEEQTTGYDFSYEAVSASIDNSLKLLQTDVIDLMQIHFGPEQQKVIDDGECVRAMLDAKAAGKIRFLGASCEGDIARQCIESGDFDVMQMNYSLLDMSNDDNIKLCREKGIGVFVKTGLGRGKLTPKVLTEVDSLQGEEKRKIQALLDLCNHDGDLLMAVAIQFLHSTSGVSSVLLGSKSLEVRLHDGRNSVPPFVQIGACCLPGLGRASFFTMLTLRLPACFAALTVAARCPQSPPC